MTVHTRRKQVTLHCSSLLFHCLISQRLIIMHALLRLDMMRMGHPYIKSCLSHIWKTMCCGKRQQRHVPMGHDTSNAPAVSGNADIRDSEGGRDEPDITSPCFSWITMLNVSMAMLRLTKQLKYAFGRCKMWFNSVNV